MMVTYIVIFYQNYIVLDLGDYVVKISLKSDYKCKR